MNYQACMTNLSLNQGQEGRSDQLPDLITTLEMAVIYTLTFNPCLDFNNPPSPD